jgi:glycosyltransferase involved in cell wall biosynthesis
MNVLWLASWFPNRTNTTTGDFIERHAKAVGPFVKQLSVIAVIKDDAMEKNGVAIEQYQTGDIAVYIAYYGSSRLQGVAGKILSQQKYLQLQQQLFQQVVDTVGMPDIIHVQVAMKAGLFALRLKKKYGIPYIVTEHWSGYFRESKPNIYEMGRVFQRLNKRVLKNASLLLPVTQNLAQTITENFIKLPYHVIPNVVDTNLFFYQPSAPEVFTFIHPSYMNYPKNPEGILEGCMLLKQKGCRFRLYMIGDRPVHLLNLAKEYGLLDEYVFFENQIPYAEVAIRMQQASALLMFSRYESLPCIILEALCCGLPIVSSRVGGIAEVIDSSNGLLVDKNSVEQLANAMQEIINTHNNFDRASIAAAASVKFSYHAVGENISKLYKQVLNKK